ncbi:glutaredoxin-2 domain protein [Capnocytophaga leadbetteri]|uniref:glutaredoxin-2 domain protein n=1 Tax=Capnocytophaga leadbetteri TaxID=327575 RepID=UPI0028EA37CB|nr:glutaredoxin-2 domain protein [Capnocytophaga leadbetteri]
MPYTITLNNDSPQALAFVEFAKNFDFLKVTKKKEAKKALAKPEIDDLEEDEYGIPIKYRDEIMALSKKVNKAVAKRWEAAIAKREQEQKI